MQNSARSAGPDLPPDITMLGAMWGVILDAEQYLGNGDFSGLGLAEARARLSAIRRCIDERIPGHPGADWPPLAMMAPGSDAGDVAGMIGGALAWRRGPATATFEELAGETVTVQVISSASRVAGGDDADALGVAAGEPLYARDGLLRAGTTICARTGLTLVPALLPGSTWGRIRAGAPCGRVLKPYGLTRGRRRVEVIPGGDPSVRAAAQLWLCGQLVGQATEAVTRELCDRIAKTTARA